MPPMTLCRELALVIVIKLVALVCISTWLIKPHVTKPTPATTATHMLEERTR
jgi:hypothetical protein